MKQSRSIIWAQAAAALLSPKLFVDFTPQQKYVLEHLKHSYPELYTGGAEVTHTEETILKLSQEIRTKVTGREKIECFNFLARGFELGNKCKDLRWDIPLGPVFIKINRERNYFTPGRFRFNGSLNLLLNHFFNNLKKPLSNNSEERLGQILLSAILFSALLDRKWVKPFLNSISKHHFYQQGKIFWVEMERVDTRKKIKIEDQEVPPPICRRLEIDDLTRLLIYRFLDTPPSKPLQKTILDPWKAIKRHLDTLDLDYEPTSLSQLIQWAFSRYLICLPGSLIGYACGDLPSTSTPIEPWLRNISGHAIPICNPKQDKHQAKQHRASKISETQNTSVRVQIQLLSTLLRDINPKSHKNKITRHYVHRKLKELRDEHKHETSITFQLLIHWAQQLLCKPRSSKERRLKKSLKPSSVHRYLTSIAEPLIRTARDSDLRKQDPSDLEGIYEQVAERRRISRYTIQRLVQFHGFLEEFYKAQEMEWIDLMDAGGPAVTNIRANLISPQIYNLALLAFGWGHKTTTRWQTLHIIVVVLLYRCGLRPSELRSLRMIDFQGITRYEIIVRNSPLGDIKTASGVRRIPLTTLLTDQEMGFVLNYYNKRLTEDHYYGGGVLLTHPVQKTGKLSDEQLFAPVRKVLRKITKDESLLLYHLRHSFVSLTNTSMLAREDIPDDILPGHGTLSNSNFIQRLKKRCFKNEPGGRRGQYLLAMLTGHNTPETTHKHYNHLADRLLGYHLKHSLSSLPMNPHLLGTITGYKRSKVYQLTKKAKGNELHKAVDSQSRKFAQDLRHPLMENAKLLNEISPLRDSTSIPGWDEVVEQSTDNKTLMTLNSKEWELAARIYETVHSMDGRRIKTARRATQIFSENYNKRWGGITLSSNLDARLLLNLLNECGLANESVWIFHHPVRNQDNDERAVHKSYWKEKLRIDILNGEPANLKGTSRRGKITIKITSSVRKKDRNRSPKMSPGALFAINTLNRLLN